MHLLIQAIILGLLTGGVYALMASGLTLAFGVMKVINVAQGAMIILGAYLSYSLFTQLHIDPFVSIVILTPAMFLLGVGLQLVFLRPLRSDEREELSLLVTWAIALGIEGLLSVVYQTTYRSTNTSYANNSVSVLGYQISVVRLLAFGVSALILTGAVPPADAHAARPLDPRDGAEPDVGAAARHQREPRRARSASGSASPRRRPPARSTG